MTLTLVDLLMCATHWDFIAIWQNGVLYTGGHLIVCDLLRFYSMKHVSVSSSGDSFECASHTNF